LKRCACRICNREILVSSPDFDELCVVCGNEFRDMMIAVAELSAEIAYAHRARKSEHALPGVPFEEIAIRMELNRIRKKS
jgi:hypothetical protein